MKSQKSSFAFVFLFLAMLACGLPGSGSSPTEIPSPTIEAPVTIIVIENTPTPAATETPSPTETPALPPEISLTVNSNCRVGPNNFYNIADQIAKDKDGVSVSLPVIGRNEDSTWWQVVNATNQECWIFGENTQPNSDFSALPIKEGPPLPDTPGNFFVTNQVCQPGAQVFEVTFNWASGANTDGFRLYRNGARIVELKAERLNYKDIKAPLGINISYELESFNKNGTSPKAVQIVPACK